ncbi:MAG TPA: hypothetical protein VE090_05805 [Methylomirabilota bacterium]|nr:hypothetical protein [Methylomirabilota bacterium]
MRGIIAVIIGYLIFAVSAVLLFQFSGRNIHSSVEGSFMLITIIYGIIFATVGGYTTAFIAKHSPLKYAKALAILMGSLALISLLSQLGKVDPWSQLAALFFMTPAAFLGGLIRAKQMRNGKLHK